MTDKQFEALLAALNNVSDNLMEMNHRLVSIQACYIKFNDPEGWEDVTDPEYDEIEEGLNEAIKASRHDV